MTSLVKRVKDELPENPLGGIAWLGELLGVTCTGAL